MNLLQFSKHLSSHTSFMLYFYNDTCGVCKTLKPLVELLVKEEFPEIQFVQVHAQESRELAGQLRMLTVPGILLFLDGREIFRTNGMISMDGLRARIERPYGMMFG